MSYCIVLHTIQVKIHPQELTNLKNEFKIKKTFLKTLYTVEDKMITPQKLLNSLMIILS